LSPSRFSSVEREQYSRHLKLTGFGPDGQDCLKRTRVLLIGAGGLGCPAGLYLAASGVGTIGVADFDRVERSNLQRQVAHTVERIGRMKAESLVTAMRAINPLITYHMHEERVGADNIGALLADYDLVLDGTDNFSTRFLVADAAWLHRRPLLQGAVYEYGAQIAFFVPGETACYRCLFEEPPRRNPLAACADVGILAVTPGTVGVMMAAEAIKRLAGLPGSIVGSLLQYDLLNQTLRRLPLACNGDCPLCGPNPRIRTVQETAAPPCAPSAPDDFPVEWTISVEEARRRIAQSSPEAFRLLDVREAFEFQASHLPNAENWPLSHLKSDFDQGPNPDKDVSLLVYCQKGVRSREAVRILRARGYENAVSLDGEMNTLISTLF
jgi:adenylyltransferase/sulfurtransferase